MAGAPASALADQSLLHVYFRREVIGSDGTQPTDQSQLMYDDHTDFDAQMQAAMRASLEGVSLCTSTKLNNDMVLTGCCSAHVCVRVGSRTSRGTSADVTASRAQLTACVL